MLIFLDQLFIFKRFRNESDMKTNSVLCSRKKSWTINKLKVVRASPNNDLIEIKRILLEIL